MNGNNKQKSERSQKIRQKETQIFYNKSVQRWTSIDIIFNIAAVGRKLE